jgi:hypothetical protein
MLAGCITIVPFFFTGSCSSVTEREMMVEAQVFDLRNAPLVKVISPVSRDVRNDYNTSRIEPLLRKEYPVRVTVRGPASDFTSRPKPGEVAREATRQFLAASLPDVRQVVR